MFPSLTARTESFSGQKMHGATPAGNGIDKNLLNNGIINYEV